MKCKNPFAFSPGPVTFWTTAIYLAVAIPIIWVHETVPPAPSDHSLYRGLNLTEAWLDLETISNAYHPYNSHENDLVREFLVNRSREILDRNGIEYGVDISGGVQWQDLLNSPTDEPAGEFESSSDKPVGVTLFDDQVSNVTWTYDTTGAVTANIGPSVWAGQYFEGNNFYVYIHGKEDPEGDWWLSESEYKKTHGKGGVLVNCHFDSVATGYGATDDGMSCVSMLQMLSYFTSAGRQPRHGIVLLFNNAEEPGLLGARAFGNSPLLNFCHTFVNLEGAGAGGRAMLFRATDLETAKAYSGSPHPFGSVVAADSFKAGVIKSGTDYQIFNGFYGQRGMDIAFYEPRARYHTEEDDARHTSVNSIWHMLSAAIASTEKLSQTTGTDFHGPRSDGKDLVQNGKPTNGVWFDLFGSAWATFALKGLFAWSLTLLVAAPLVLLVLTTLLVRQNKYYYFSRDVRIHSELNDDPVTLGGWKGFFRFPLALIFAGGLTVASVFLLAKFNPLIVYSSGYAVWAMTISLFYFAFWLIMRGSSFVRPTALHRGFVNIWLFSLGWAVQVVAAVAEDRMHIGALYFTVFLQSGVFVSLVVSLAEQFALPAKRDFALEMHDAHQARDHSANQGESAVSDEEPEESQHEHEHEHEESDDDGDNDADSPTETTPLRAGEQSYGSNDQPTFANTYRQRSASDNSPAAPPLRRYAPYDHEQSWSGRLPSWTWIIQFLLLAPVPVLLIGNLGLVAMSSLSMTATDGGSLLTPIMATGLMSIMLLLPLTPFMHRVTHHVPTFLLLIFVGTFIYNLAAFPFSTNHRFKFYFQQVLDLDEGTNVVTLAGLEQYVRPVIGSLPVAAGQTIDCKATVGRDLADCQYDASSLPPNLVDGKKPEELMNVTIERSGSTAQVLVDALDTRTCYLDLSAPVFGFSVEGGGQRDPRFGAFPPHGLQHLQIWRRDWEKPWNVTLKLTDRSKSLNHELETIDDSSSFKSDELKARSTGADISQRDKPLEVTVRCAWSDANKPSTIPAFHELKKYMPTWAVATKKTVGLVEIKKRYSVPT